MRWIGLDETTRTLKVSSQGEDGVSSRQCRHDPPVLSQRTGGPGSRFARFDATSSP